MTTGTPGRRQYHGRYWAYAMGCRCDACREHQRSRNARSRASRIIVTHGIRSSYDAGCRCEACRGARHEAYSRLASEQRWRKTEDTA